MSHTYNFPIPRITESFVDAVIDKLGWNRYEELKTPDTGHLNADYISPCAVLELKIFEEDGVEKLNRQDKISNLFLPLTGNEYDYVDISIETIPGEIKRNFENIISEPLKGPVKKASKQISQTRDDFGLNLPGVLIAVNNGYSYLDADHFERLILNRCKNDTNNIDYVFCVTVDYHQGDFDGYVLCTTRCHNIRGDEAWESEEKFRVCLQDAFDESMTIMMGDQMNPDLRSGILDPIRDIIFDRGGVTYIREAPHIPDSRFDE